MKFVAPPQSAKRWYNSQQSSPASETKLLFQMYNRTFQNIHITLYLIVSFRKSRLLFNYITHLHIQKYYTPKFNPFRTSVGFASDNRFLKKTIAKNFIIEIIF